MKTLSINSPTLHYTLRYMYSVLEGEPPQYYKSHSKHLA